MPATLKTLRGRRETAQKWLIAAACLLPFTHVWSAEPQLLPPSPAVMERQQAPGQRQLARGARSTAAKRSMDSQEGGSWWTSLGGLCLVIALIAAGAKVLKRHVPHLVRPLPNEVVQVLGKRYLEHRQFIQFVRCGSRILVLAQTPNGLNTLAEITDPAEVDYISGLCRARPDAESGGFLKLLQAAVGVPTAADSAAERLKSRLRTAPGGRESGSVAAAREEAHA